MPQGLPAARAITSGIPVSGEQWSTFVEEMLFAVDSQQGARRWVANLVSGVANHLIHEAQVTISMHMGILGGTLWPLVIVDRGLRGTGAGSL